MITLLTILFVGMSIALVVFSSRWRRAARANYIRRYQFPRSLMEKVGKRRPELALKDRRLAARALKQFFLVYLKCGYKPVSMPSQLVDEVWHEFILHTKSYEQFCRKAFGRFMHQTPAVVSGEYHGKNDNLGRTWWYACLEENINPRKANRLPLLFALDGNWDAANGFPYAPDYKEREESTDDEDDSDVIFDFSSDGDVDGNADGSRGDDSSSSSDDSSSSSSSDSDDD